MKMRMKTYDELISEMAEYARLAQEMTGSTCTPVPFGGILHMRDAHCEDLADGKAMVARKNEIAALARELYVDEPGMPPRECFTLAEEFFAYQDEWFKEKKDSPHEGNG